MLKDQGYKILLVGAPAVGKTTFIKNVINDESTRDQSLTTGINIFSVREQKDQEEGILLQVWDIAGQSTFEVFRTKFYRGADAILLVFDLHKPKTFEQLRDWISEIYNSYQPPKILPMILIGNKADLCADNPCVDSALAREYTDELAAWSKLAVEYVQISALKRENLKKVFDLLIKILPKKGI